MSGALLCQAKTRLWPIPGLLARPFVFKRMQGLHDTLVILPLPGKFTLQREWFTLKFQLNLYCIK